MFQAASLSLVYFKVVSCDFVSPPKATYVRNQMLFHGWKNASTYITAGMQCFAVAHHQHRQAWPVTSRSSGGRPYTI